MDSITLVKVISALLYPLGLMLMLSIGGLAFRWIGWRRWSLFCGAACLTVLVLASNPLFARWLTQSLESQYPPLSMNDIPQHDTIIVLGGGMSLPMPPAKHAQLSHGADRFWYATRLYRANKARTIVVAGGNVFEQPGVRGEAYYVRELLLAWGVPDNAVVIETASRNTRQNLANVEVILQQKKIRSALLVTSAMHMPRAYTHFRQLPITVTPASADVLVRDVQAPELLNWIPSAGALQLSTKALHEYYGHWFNQISNAWNVVKSSF